MCISRSVISDSLWLHGLQPARLFCPWNSPGKNTGVGCHSLLQGIFLTQGSNSGLPYCRQIFYGLSNQGSTHDPAIPILGIYLDKAIIWKDTCTLMIKAALFTIAKTWKQPKRIGTDEWIKKIWCVPQNEIVLSHKKIMK